MIRDLKDAYAGSWRFMLACPILFALPVAVEGLQHAAEYGLGMYAGMAEAQAVETHPLRMGLGYLKASVLALSAYWIIRYLALGASQAARLDPKAIRLFAPVMLWHLAWGALLLWGGGLLTAAGIEGSAAFRIGLSVFLGNFVLETALSAWKSGAALGNERMTFAHSLRIVGRHLPWSLAFFLAAVMPVMVVHYAFAFFAIGGGGLVIPLLVVDSLLVGYLGTLIVAASFIVARRTAARAGETLAPGDRPEAVALPRGTARA
jgi:hypothetical protein